MRANGFGPFQDDASARYCFLCGKKIKNYPPFLVEMVAAPTDDNNGSFVGAPYHPECYIEKNSIGFHYEESGHIDEV
jgi:hypothetical protein